MGTGKTRALDVIGGICYKPISASGTATVSAIFRLLQMLDISTLVIDEADFNSSDERADITKILNGGFETGRPVLRTNKDTHEIETFKVYGPKVLASRQSFTDQALESRCFPIIMTQTARKDIPIQLPRKFDTEQRELREKLLTYRMMNYAIIDPDKVCDIDLGEIEPRLKQMALPMLNVIGIDPQTVERFKGFLKNHSRTIIEARGNEIDGIILRYLFELCPWDHPTTSQDILYKMQEVQGSESKMTPQKIGKRLRVLGMEVRQTKVDDINKRVIIIDKVKARALAKRYFLPEDLPEDLKEVPDPIPIDGFEGVKS